MKRIIIILLLLSICVTMLSSCEIERYKVNAAKATNNIIIPTKISENLYYDINTKIVYIIWYEQYGNQGYSYMSPYIASNGYPYIYDGKNNMLVEIEEKNNVY